MFRTVVASALISLLGCFGGGAPDPALAPKAANIYEFKVKDIDGKEVNLAQFKGKVLLVVNVASKCGLTPQYKGLEELYQEYKDKGLVILGFPANNFGNQEPGSEKEIKEFCSLNYRVTFPMFAKVSVKGDDIADIYRWLIANSDRPKDAVEWNFGKFLIGRDGKVIKRFAPMTGPTNGEIKAAIEAALATKE
jgi:glutathione peroxidase